jgi:hypothetical protein
MSFFHFPQLLNSNQEGLLMWDVAGINPLHSFSLTVNYLAGSICLFISNH